jgi:hypothetical protein
VGTRSRSAGIIRIAPSAIPILKLQIERLADLNPHENLSEEVRSIWGDDRMRKIIRKSVRFGAAHISKACTLF